MGFWADRVLPILVEKACRSHAILEERRRWVPLAHGEVLELGVGSGLNLAFYDAAKVTKVTGLDPSVPLLERAAARSVTAPVPVELVRGRAEALPFPDRSFDSAVVTYSLCSVDDPQQALREVRRVLRPGGALILVEHGLADNARTRRWQRWLTPAWRRIGGGCHLDRDMTEILRAAGYQADVTAAYTEGASWLSYTYQGTARPAW